MPSGPTAPADPGLAELITSRIRDIPDYPQPGIVFKDITPLLADGAAFAAVVAALAAGPRAGSTRWSGSRPAASSWPPRWPAACGRASSRSASRASCPAEPTPRRYELEYGTATVEVHPDAFEPGDRVLIVDDVLATGGTAAATASLVRRSGAEVAGDRGPAGTGFLNGRASLPGLEVRSLLARCDRPRGAGHVMNRPPIDWLLRRT